MPTRAPEMIDHGGAWEALATFVKETGREVSIRVYPDSVTMSNCVTLNNSAQQEMLDGWGTDAPGFFVHGFDIQHAWESFIEVVEEAGLRDD